MPRSAVAGRVSGSRLVGRTFLATLVLAAASAFGQDAAVTLKVGDPAPPLKVGKWIKGEPVTKFEPGTVYVIECWATWCGPCIAAIPHVNSLQKKYDGKVVVIGQNMWENDEAAVGPFMEKMGAKMEYRVVMDDKSTEERGAMAKTWMEAAGRNGIPCSFIVDKAGKVAWIGHPMAMDKPLEEVVAGTYDAKAGVAKEEGMKALQKKLTAAIESGDTDEAVKILDEVSASNPGFAKQATLYKYDLLIKANKFDQAYALGDKLYELGKDDAQLLNKWAWEIATEEGYTTRDLKLAKRLADRAVEITNRKDAAILDTLARVHFDTGEVDKAIEIQTEAVGKADAGDKKELEEALERYKKAKK